jgi:hypothetical protein
MSTTTKPLDFGAANTAAGGGAKQPQQQRMSGAAVIAPPPMAVPAAAPAPALEEVLKARKPYTSTNSQYCWTKLELDKFVEALQL